MKKRLLPLLLAAMSVAPAALSATPEDGLYLYGSVTGASYECNDATRFDYDEKSGLYSLTGVEMNTQTAYDEVMFIFVKYEDGIRTNYGATEEWTDGELDVDLDIMEGDYDFFFGEEDGVFDFTVDLENMTCVVTESDVELTPKPEVVYVVGDFNDWNYEEPLTLKKTFTGTFYKSGLDITDKGIQISMAKGSKEEFEAAGKCLVDGETLVNGQTLRLVDGSSVITAAWAGVYYIKMDEMVTQIDCSTDTPDPNKPLAPSSISPSSGEKLTSLHSFTIRYDSEIKEISTASGLATLTSDDETVELTPSFNGKRLTLTAPEEITAGGKYVLEIKEGLVTFIPGMSNAAHEWTYTITEFGDMDVYVFGDIENHIQEEQCEEGKMKKLADKVYMIEKITLTGDDLAEGYGDFIFQAYDPESGELVAEFTSTDDDGVTISLDEPEPVYIDGYGYFSTDIEGPTAFSITLDLNNMTVTVSNPIASYVKEFNVVDEKENIYYDMMGRRVHNPDHGIYICNGKKIIK